MYPEYDPNEPTLGQSFADILRGFKNPQAYQQVGQGLVNTAKVIPNVTESLGRGGGAQAIGTTGDLRDIRNTVQSYLPQSVQNFSNVAEFFANPYAKALIQKAPTTEQTLEAVPRVTAPYEGYKQHETLGEYIAPSLGYFGAKAIKATKDLPIGMTIQDVTPPVEPVKMAEALRQPEKNTMGFYSPLDEAVMNLQNQKGTGQQYLAQLLKTQGVKQEEVATRGLDTFLTENPKVTKTQIEEFLGQNPVQLKETVLGVPEKFDANRLNQLEKEYSGLKEHAIDDPSFGEDKYDEMIKLMNLRDNSTVDSLYEAQGKIERLAQQAQRSGNKAKADELWRESELLNTRAEKLDLKGLGTASPTKFGKPDFNLPNGKNYREVLIQLPSERMDIMEAAKQHYKTFIQRGGEPNFDRLPYEKQMEIVNTMPNEAKNVSSKGEFVNISHFEQPNILAHMRVDDRVIDGKKTLFIQEIQSDWHQAGRKKGYQNDRGVAQIDKELDAVVNELRSKPNVQYAPSEEDWARYPELTARYDALSAERANAPKSDAVPNAPFKKNWQELAMKRAMQMAAEGGYDRVAFTTGKQQNARYNLSNHVSKIAYEKGDNGLYDIYANNRDGKEIISKEDITLDQIEETFGKDMAKKISEDQGKAGDGTGYRNWKTFTGVDLEVGGEGMKGFYDKILPDFINKYGKKHGLKVGQTKLPPDLNINSIVLNHTGLSRKEWDALSKVEKEQTLKEIGYGGNEGVHYFDLTPEAKESFLKKGQPMFAVAPAMAITDEDSRRDVLEKLFNSKK